MFNFINIFINRLIINKILNLALSILYLIIKFIDNVFLCIHGILMSENLIKDIIHL